MNIFLIKRDHNPISALTRKNYGLDRPLFAITARRNNLSSRFLDRKASLFFNHFLIQQASRFNRLLRLSRKKSIEETKKQSSWRSLRFRQGLPVNGQRTHTNARVAKKANASVYSYNI